MTTQSLFNNLVFTDLQEKVQYNSKAQFLRFAGPSICFDENSQYTYLGENNDQFQGLDNNVSLTHTPLPLEVKESSNLLKTKSLNKKFKLAKIHSLRVSKCSIPLSSNINIKRVDDNVYYNNLTSCKSSVCNKCRQKREIEDKKRIDRILSNAFLLNSKVLFTTLTIPHSRKESFDALYKELIDSFTLITRRKSLKEKYQYDFIKKVETTLSIKNGFHNHLHILFIFPESVNVDVSNFSALFYSEWSKVAKKNYGKQCDKKGYKSFEITSNEGISTYFSKSNDLAFELSNSTTKQAKKDNINVLDLLTEYEKTGKKCYLNAFHEYEKGINNKNIITYSRSIKKYESCTKNDIDELNKEPIDICTFTKALFMLLVRNNKEVEVLHLIKQFDFENDDFYRLIYSLQSYFKKEMNVDTSFCLERFKFDLIDT